MISALIRRPNSGALSVRTMTVSLVADLALSRKYPLW
jgi:hypothetical protein